MTGAGSGAAGGALTVITGPTASGKSAVALEVARRLQGEIVSLDAIQVYRGLDIGTAKPGPEERRTVPHHLLDIREPEEPMEVRGWLDLADRAVAEIRGRGAAAVVSGGTAFYLVGLLHGIFEGPGASQEVRERLRGERDRFGAAALHARLAARDAAAAARIHPRDWRRIERALEILETGTRTVTDLRTQWAAEPVRACRVFVLERDRRELHRRIGDRVDAMMAAGFLEEVRGLLALGRLVGEAARALGYRQLAAHLRGEMGLAEAVEATKIATRRYAKQQMTWFRRLQGAVPVPLEGDGTAEDAALRIIDLVRAGGPPARLRPPGGTP